MEGQRGTELQAALGLIHSDDVDGPRFVTHHMGHTEASASRSEFRWASDDNDPQVAANQRQSEEEPSKASTPGDVERLHSIVAGMEQ